MSEERVTKSIIKYLKNNQWTIYSYDFPQSGTGILIKKDNDSNNKNKDAIIPDIIAIKEKICIFFENKDRIVVSDFEKVNKLIIDNEYENNIGKILNSFHVEKYYYGIGIPNTIKYDKLNNLLDLTDFVMLVEKNNNIKIYYDKNNIF